MSTSDLYKVYKTKAKHVAEYRNGWGTGPVLWDYLCVNHLGLPDMDWLINSSHHPMWALKVDKGIHRNMRLVHAMCHDHVIISKELMPAVADACDYVYKYTHELFPNKANHWAEIAEDLRKIKVDKRCLGVGLSCTSVCDNWISWKGGEEINPILEMIGEK
jgi:hypothetical protein